MECQLENVTAAGDHYFVLARVLGLGVRAAADPLVFHNHGFSGLR
jgi:flavin reductase (DIM6/NTAB) family NADH-FMN oxidoreductase RutF